MVAEICGFPLLRHRRKRRTKAADQMPTRELATAMVSTSGIAESAKLLMVYRVRFLDVHGGGKRRCDIQVVAQPRSLVRRVGRVRGLNLSNLTVAIRSDVRDAHDCSLATDRTPPA